MASALPFLLVGAAFLLMRKKDGVSADSGGEEYKPKKQWEEGDPIPDDWVPVPKIGDGPQRYIKPPVEMTLKLSGQQQGGVDPVPQPEPEPEPGADVPGGSHCADVADWDPAWVSVEEQMLAAVNELRAQGYACAGGSQSPAPALTMNPNLRCSARKHSKDMALNNYFSHTNQQGEESWDRIWASGFEGSKASENITAGPSNVQQALQNFLTSTQGHCEAMFDPGMTEIGIGYFPHNTGYQFYWTQNFGGP